MRLKEVPFEHHKDLHSKIKSGEISFIHANHFNTGNSGYSDFETFEYSLLYSENFSQFLEKYKNPSTSVHSLFQPGMKEARFKYINKFYQNCGFEFNTDVIPIATHGSGTMWEYFQHTPGNIIPLTIHGSRGTEHNGAIIKYRNETELDAPRGIFALQNMELLQEIAEQYEKENKRAAFVLEEENLGTSSEAQEVYELVQRQRKHFHAIILSTHVIDMYGNGKGENIENLRFIDGTEEDFQAIFEGHNGDLTQVICTYVRSQIAHLERVDDESVIPQILGHCDLIKLAFDTYLKSQGLNKQEERRIKIQELFAKTEIENSYRELFTLAAKKDIAVEANVSGYAKDVGVYPSKEILKIAVECGVKIVLSSDVHSIEQMYTAYTEKYLEALTSVLPENAKIYTLVDNKVKAYQEAAE